MFEQLAGNGQSYCLCDTGLCGPASLPPVTLRAGNYAGAFSWDGKNWNGPSDTDNPKGAPFSIRHLHAYGTRDRDSRRIDLCRVGDTGDPAYSLRRFVNTPFNFGCPCAGRNSICDSAALIESRALGPIERWLCRGRCVLCARPVYSRPLGGWVARFAVIARSMRGSGTSHIAATRT